MEVVVQESILCVTGGGITSVRGWLALSVAIERAVWLACISLLPCVDAANLETEGGDCHLAKNLSKMILHRLIHISSRVMTCSTSTYSTIL